ncbi:hydroxyproline-rich glycoprotein family protein [Raphanus sativus]|uniref:Extensin-like n=1 Tax=Raphanus sativus TaxID=3726 RepID=A0A9W3BY65_RAPSA|nr:extensin-like [Raphanus sativus]KAJ4886483.1 hydroxyproline-rich glycoprotein family protein [Raphanus sativus]
MEVTKNCELCEQKVTGIMQSIIAVYSVSFGDIMKLEARANPNLFMAVIIKYRDHAKVNRLHFEGAPVTPQPGEGGGGYYNAPHVNYPYPYSPYAPPQQQFLAGNYGYPMLKQPPPPQKEKEAPEGVHKQQHTVPPPYAMQPPPPMPLSSYSYIEPPYWPAAPPSGGKCVIM